MLVDDDPVAPSYGRSRLLRARFPRAAPPLYGDGHASELVSQPLCTLRARDADAWDVAIIGAGYVGVPLAQTFADAGQRVLLVDVVPELVRRDQRRGNQPHRGRSLDEPARPATSRPGKITATADYEQAKQSRRDPDRAAHSAHPTAPARPQLRRSCSPGRGRRAPAGPDRRPRIDDLPGHDARGRPADPRSREAGLRGRQVDFHPGDVTRARGPRTHRLDDQDDPEGGRGAHPGVHTGGRGCLPHRDRHRARGPRRPSRRS